MLDYINSNAGTFRTITGELSELAGRVKVFDEIIAVAEGIDKALVESLKTAASAIKESTPAEHIKHYLTFAEKAQTGEKQVRK